ncbi:MULTISPECIES: hypothetical protein [unclassified Curtobacterium]|uniref:hypothetical protein n=1 Tax=unclassified Curtobacterium TaxID=257496 RepID=UPI003806837C
MSPETTAPRRRRTADRLRAAVGVGVLVVLPLVIAGGFVLDRTTSAALGQEVRVDVQDEHARIAIRMDSFREITHRRAASLGIALDESTRAYIARGTARLVRGSLDDRPVLAAPHWRMEERRWGGKGGTGPASWLPAPPDALPVGDPAFDRVCPVSAAGGSDARAMRRGATVQVCEIVFVGTTIQPGALQWDGDAGDGILHRTTRWRLPLHPAPLT